MAGRYWFSEEVLRSLGSAERIVAKGGEPSARSREKSFAARLKPYADHQSRSLFLVEYRWGVTIARNWRPARPMKPQLRRFHG